MSLTHRMIPTVAVASPSLTEAERQRLLVDGNQTRVPAPHAACLHQLFEVQAAGTPEAVAVVFEDQELTYRELDTRANQLAHYLRARGVGPETLVGICPARSLEMVVGLLGILKAGGAYVPLDPAYPQDRLAFMLDDVRAPVLLTQERLKDRLPAQHIEHVCLDTDWPVIARESEANPAREVTTDNLAYVIYTSGSTGRPKGVAICHSSAVTFVHWAKTVFPAEDLAGVLASTSICFDLSVFELFVPLSWGGKVVLAENLLHLPTLPAAAEVTLINTVPSAIAALLRLSRVPPSVRTVNLAGEPLPKSLVQQLYRHDTIERVFNLYGPTEDTTYSTFALVEKTDSEPPSIGRPIANTQVFVLDADLEPVPIGVAGELYIGGDGLARGYLNRPELTAERFIANPFRAHSGPRLYKTGDLVRYRPDGNLEYLGRIDHQVKIRGFRIELGEIEAVLSQNPTVQHAVVLAREEAEGEPRLVAYIVPGPEAHASVGELRGFLRRQLPEHMLPAAFVFLDALPLTPNGKLDRRALPAPDDARPTLDSAFVAPRTPLEDAVARIWAEVLKVQRVGVHDSFFELGGHSLLAAQIVSRVRATLDLELPLRALFETPTAAGIAETLERIRKAEPPLPTPPPVCPVPRERALPLSFAQQRLWFLEQLEPGSAAYHIPCAFRLRGPLDVAALGRSLNEIVRRHEALRTTFDTDGSGQPIQLISPTASLSLPVVDLRGCVAAEREARIERAIAEEARRPFDLTRGPLVRTLLVQGGEEEHVLLLTMHHIVSDGWSLGVLVRELEILYSAYANGQVSPLPELSVQYADFAQWQRRWLPGEVQEAQLSYWTPQLAGLPALELPTDRPRPAAQTHRGAHESLRLSPAASKAVRTLSQARSVTPFMLLLAAFKVLLSRYTGQEDIVVGVPSAGRTRVELEELIGFFVNTLVLRSDLSGDPEFGELLERVREVALEAHAHQDVPFEKLVEELQPQRDVSRTPLFQVFFNLLTVSDGELRLPGLTITTSPPLEVDAKFDLTLYVIEQPEGFDFSLAYNTDLFDSGTMTQMLHGFRTLLEAVVSDPRQRLSRLSLASETERDRRAACANVARPTLPFVRFPRIEQSIPDRFQEQVRQFPRHVAVKTAGYEWTYEDLDRRANQVARTVLTPGGQGAERIALLLEHDAPMIAALLGVAKAGQTYVPLDPSYPKERLVHILRDSQASTILTDTTHRAFAETLAVDPVRLITLDEIDARSGGVDLDLRVSPDALAYLLYTSGSTGQPKGVMQNHRNVLSHIRNYANNLHIDAADRLTLLSAYGFDAAVMDIFGALLTGATLYPMSIKRDGLATLAEWLVRHEITIYHSTPTVYRHFVATLTGKEDFSRLRLVVLGGEAVYRTDVELFRRHFSPRCIFVNGLGPTESTVSLQYFVDRHTVLARQAVPVGYPVEDTEVLLLNAAGEATEIRGEIAIRSSQLALGYWQRLDLTKAAFLPDPQGGSKRIYRTGDLGRRLPDGSLEFEGRRDSQVKLRGFRIELGEIEAVLGRHPAIRETAVIAREERSGDKQLVAYIVAAQGPAPSSLDLRHFLQRHLPDYMVPSLFVVRDALPLTPTGKTDRRALSALEQAAPEQQASFVAPREMIEYQLTEIWEELLGIRPIGIRDNFFELGGHSLLAVRMMDQIERACGKRLPLAILFTRATVEQLADALLQPGSQDNPPVVVKVQAGGAKRPFFFLDGDYRSGGFYCVNLARHLGTDQPFYALRPDEGKATIENMASHHLETLRAIQPEGPYLLGGHCNGALIAFEMAQQLRRQGQKVDLLALIEAGADNTRFGLLDSLVRGWGNLRGLGSDERLTWFLRFTGLRELSLPEIAKRIPRFILRRAIARLRTQAVRPAPASAGTTQPEADPITVTPEARARRAREIYRRAIAGYVPRAYPGRVTLFAASTGTREEHPGNPTLGWNEVADEVETYSVPGDHLTCVTLHVRTLAEHLRTCLQKV